MAEIRTFKTGAIRDIDSSKEVYDETISWTAFKRYGQYMTGKRAKYGGGNFKKGIPITSYEQSLLRHVQKYMENKYEEGDIETEEDHLSAILFNTFGILHEEEMSRKKEKKSQESLANKEKIDIFLKKDYIDFTTNLDSVYKKIKSLWKTI